MSQIKEVVHAAMKLRDYLINTLRDQHDQEDVMRFDQAMFRFECRPSLPKVVCLCGSTRFRDEFMRANYRETMAGNIVLSVGFFGHSLTDASGESVGCTAKEKIALDVLHKRKIDLADEVLVLNVGGYIGESTRSEIGYALDTRKPIRYLEAV